MHSVGTREGDPSISAKGRMLFSLQTSVRMFRFVLYQGLFQWFQGESFGVLRGN